MSRARGVWALVVVLGITVVVACSTPASSTSSSSCPAPNAGQESCGSCGSQCYYCATGTCPADPCTAKVCDGTAHCSTTNPNTAHSSYSYCGSCASTNQCVYCPAGTCSSDPCSSKCDGSGGNGPVGSGGGGGSSSGGTSSSSGGSSSSGSGGSSSCPAGSNLQCSQWIACKNCSIQSCTCYDNNGNTPYCGMYYHASDGQMFWCGSSSDCSTFNCNAQAQNATAHCCQ